MRKKSFTLVELLAALGIMAVLSILLLPQIQMWRSRAQFCQAKTDMKALRDALTVYYFDYDHYPPEETNNLSHLAKIDCYVMLTTPVAYISSIPRLPWEDRLVPLYSGYRLLKYIPQGNYVIHTGGGYLERSSIGWELLGGGPLGFLALPNQKTWYSPTNGISSNGGLYLHSNGRGII